MGVLRWEYFDGSTSARTVSSLWLLPLVPERRIRPDCEFEVLSVLLFLYVD